MIKFVSLIVALLVSVPALAGFASAVIGGGATKSAAGSWTVKGLSATAANGAFTTPATVTAAGKLVTMPASASFAANAATVAVFAVRLNPTGLVVSAVASWLLAEGLEWSNNSWTKIGPATVEYNADGGAWSTDQATACRNRWGSGGTIGPQPTGATICWSSPQKLYSTYMNARCPGSGNAVATWSGGVGVCSGTSRRAAIESDFVAAASDQAPDAAYQQLARADVAIPVNEPVLNPASVDSYGAPYLDVISGRQVKELTRITPDPTPENPFNVRVDKYQVDAGAVPGQTTAPVAAPKEASISNQIEPIEFPSDYARQGEAQAAADSINSTLGPKLDKIVETGADPSDPLQPQGSEFDQAFFQGTFANLLGWQLPAHTSQCPTSGFDWNGQTYTINSHCQLVEDHFSAFSSVMSVVWTILALFILLGA